MSTGAWILIIAMYTPGGDYMDKRVVRVASQTACEAARAQLAYLDHPLRVRHLGVCVTESHWRGTGTMPRMPLD